MNVHVRRQRRLHRRDRAAWDGREISAGRRVKSERDIFIVVRVIVLRRLLSPRLRRESEAGGDMITEGRYRNAELLIDSALSEMVTAP